MFLRQFCIIRTRLHNTIITDITKVNANMTSVCLRDDKNKHSKAVIN